MREAENTGEFLQTFNFSGDEVSELTDISDMLERDMLRYERLLDAGEETNED